MRAVVRTGACVVVAYAALLTIWVVPRASALDSPGGVAAPLVTPPTGGTGGTEYEALAPSKPPSAKRAAHRKPAPHRPVPSKPAPRKPAAKPKPAAPPNAAASPSGGPTPAQTLAEGALFPVLGAHSFGGPENRFGAGRAGHIHQGQDVLAGEGVSVVAPLPGTIVTTGYQAGGAGWYVAESVADGLSFFYAHCQAGSVAVRAEQPVRAGTQLCRVGQTGDATGPHLHFEIWVGGWRVGDGYPIDPLSYLEAWDR